MTCWPPGSGIAHERGGDSGAAPRESSFCARSTRPVHAAHVVPSGGLFCCGPVNCCVLRRLANKAEGIAPRSIAPANKADHVTLPLDVKLIPGAAIRAAGVVGARGGSVIGAHCEIYRLFKFYKSQNIFA